MKKPLSLFLLIAFINLLVSCYSDRVLAGGEEIDNQSMDKRLKVLSVYTKDGNHYTFNEGYPARISDSKVTGTPEVKWNFNSADSIRFSNDRKDQKFLWKNGVKYEIIAKDKTDFICLTTEKVNISFDTIAKMNFKQYNKTETTFLIVGMGTSILVALTLIAWTLTYNWATQ
jgi:hypothetical protein